jgi:hypothetical protein
MADALATEATKEAAAATSVAEEPKFIELFSGGALSAADQPFQGHQGRSPG